MFAIANRATPAQQSNMNSRTADLVSSCNQKLSVILLFTIQSDIRWAKTVFIVMVVQGLRIIIRYMFGENGWIHHYFLIHNNNKELEGRLKFLINQKGSVWKQGPRIFKFTSLGKLSSCCNFVFAFCHTTLNWA